jgi:hypothetical protein
MRPNFAIWPARGWSAPRRRSNPKRAIDGILTPKPRRTTCSRLVIAATAGVACAIGVTGLYSQIVSDPGPASIAGAVPAVAGYAYGTTSASAPPDATIQTVANDGATGTDFGPPAPPVTSLRRSATDGAALGSISGGDGSDSLARQMGQSPPAMAMMEQPLVDVAAGTPDEKLPRAKTKPAHGSASVRQPTRKGYANSNPPADRSADSWNIFDDAPRSGRHAHVARPGLFDAPF